jgi:hypothetical protein
MDGSSVNLAELFPAACDKSHVRHPPPASLGNPSAVQLLPTKARAILALELRGLPKTEIAVRLRMKENAVRRITHTDRYIAARDVLLGHLDADFRAMKPMAFNALRNGLQSGDVVVALRASDQWMRAAGFIQHGKCSAGQRGVSAEDVARKLLTVDVNVKINRGPDDQSSSK